VSVELQEVWVAAIRRHSERAAAVLIDATIIRGVLLPASMRVLGDSFGAGVGVRAG
jgi:hypothetical protein